MANRICVIIRIILYHFKYFFVVFVSIFVVFICSLGFVNLIRNCEKMAFHGN